MSEDTLAPTCDVCHRSPPAVAFPVREPLDTEERLCKSCRREREVLDRS